MAGTVSGGGGVGKAVGIGCGCLIVIVVIWVGLAVLGWVAWLLRDMFMPGRFEPGDRGGYSSTTLDKAYERERAFDAEVYERAGEDESLRVPEELLQAHKKAFVEVQRELKRRMDREGRQRAYQWLATETRHGRRRADPDPNIQPNGPNQPDPNVQPDQPQINESRPRTIPQQRRIAPPKPGPTILEDR